MITKDKPNKVTTTLKVIITGEFYDDEASEETLRYCVEQDLEDAGFDVDVTSGMQNDLISKSNVLAVYAELYDIFDDNKEIQKELSKVYNKLNNLKA